MAETVSSELAILGEDIGFGKYIEKETDYTDNFSHCSSCCNCSHGMKKSLKEKCDPVTLQFRGFQNMCNARFYFAFWSILKE
jgi:hypothetical protein